MVRFGVFDADFRTQELRKQGVRVRLPQQSFQILRMLLERSGELVSRDELRQALWPVDTFVDFDHGLNNSINRIRDALNDSADTPRYIETLPRLGYRFIGNINGAAAAPSSEPPLLEANRLIDRRVLDDATNQRQYVEPAPRRERRLVAAVGGLANGAAVKSEAQESRADVATTYLPNIRKRRHSWYWVALCATAAALAGVGLLRFRPTPSPPSGRIMLAVLPFQNLSGDSQQEYLSDGLTEETISDLGQLAPEKLGVIARTSAMAYKQTTKTIGQVGQELGVDYVLEGSVRRDAGKVRVSAQLIRVRDQTHVWAHNYDRELHDLLVFQNELGSAIAEQVQIQLDPQRKMELARRRTVDAEAYEDYLKGRHFWYQFRLDSLNKSIDYYERALGKDPNYAPAYAGLAAAYSVRANLYGRTADDFPKAKEAAQRALDLDESLTEAHEAMAAVHIFYDWDWAAADRELTRSEQLNPPSPERCLRAYWFEIRGDTDSAIAVLKRGLRLDPFNPLLNADLGNAYYYARRPDEALTQYRENRESDPNFPLGNGRLGAAYEQKGDRVAAAAEYRKQGDSLSLVVLQAREGHPSAARTLLNQLESAKQSADPGSMARLCVALGDNKEAVNWLTKAYDNRAHWMIWLRVDPIYDALRSDPRFQEILRSMRFPE